MTAPVTQSAVPVKLEMTAPVTQAAVAGGMLVQFVLPKGVTLESAPEPLDARVQLREVPPSRWRSSATPGSGRSRTTTSTWRSCRPRSTGRAWPRGEPVLARYNAPFTPWFMRRNEIWLAVR